MIFSKSIKNIKLNKSAYEAHTTSKLQKPEQCKQATLSIESDDSVNEDSKLYSHPMIQNKKIHKVIVIGGGQISGIKPQTIDVNKVQTRVLNIQQDNNSKNESNFSKPKSAQTYGVFLRNVHSKVGENDLIEIIGQKDLLGIKISNRTGEMNFQNLAAAENAQELLNDKHLHGLKIKTIAQYELPKKDTQPITKPIEAFQNSKVIKVVRREEEEHNGLRMNQKSESIFSRIQFKKD